MNTTRMSDQHASASDDSLQAVAEKMKGLDRPIRLRFPLQLWTGKEYIAWRQEVWRIEVKDAEEAKELRASLELFLQTIDRCGTAACFTALQAVQDAERLRPALPAAPDTEVAAPGE